MKKHGIKVPALALLLTSSLFLNACSGGEDITLDGAAAQPDLDMNFTVGDKATEETEDDSMPQLPAGQTASDAVESDNGLNFSYDYDSLDGLPDSNNNPVETTVSESTFAADTQPGSNNISVTENELIMTLIELNDQKAEFLLSNGTDVSAGYGLTPYFQVKRGESWEDVEPLMDIAIPEIWAELPSGGINYFTLTLADGYGEKIYGDLSSGRYRAGVMLNIGGENQMLWCEFEIR